MIQIFTNSLGSGDWTVIKRGEQILFEGHNPSVWELAAIFEELGHTAGVIECDDVQMEEGTY